MTCSTAALLALALVACGGASGAESPPASSAPSPAVEPREQDEPDDQPREHVPRTLSDAQLDQDIALATSGSFVVDHIGPEAMADVRARFEAYPEEHLARFEELYFVREGAHMAPIPAHLRSQVLLGHLHAHAPERVRAVADRHHRIDRQSRQRGHFAEADQPALAERDRSLALLADGIDVAIESTWSPVTPDDWCLDSAPVVGTLVRISRRCTCGEPLACSAELRDGILTVRARTDPSAPSVCTDCYPTHAGCTLPELPPDATVPVVIESESAGSLQTAFNGVPLDPPRCR